MALIDPQPPGVRSFYLGDHISHRDKLKTLADLLEAKYHFRPGARESNKVVSTWVDQDDSGNYNPDCKEVELAPTTKRKREILYRSDGYENDRAPKKPKAITWQLGRQIGLINPITLKCTSDRGRAFLRKLSVFSDNWPQLGFDTQDDSDPYTSSLSTSKDSFSTILTSQTSQSYLLRSHFGNTSNYGRFSRPAWPIPSCPDLGELTLGHPEARGCKPCLELRQVCPLLTEGPTYPCDHCIEDNIECELVIPPAKKGACERCRSRRIICSYREGGDHSLPCKQCVQSDYKCVAGPESGRVRTGPSLDQDIKAKRSSLPTLKRAFVSCTTCRKVKKWCSLKDKTKEPPCNHCRRDGKACTFEKLEDKPKASKKAPTIQVSNKQQPSSQNPVASQATTKMITTRFAHPISFNYELPDDNSYPCHFCEHVAYGILGLGMMKAEVIDYRNGEGYVEISGGHTGEGREQTECTLERVRIHFCKVHMISPIFGLIPEEFDFDAAFKELLPTGCSGIEGGATQWCSVCSSPAFFECSTPQVTDMYGLPANAGTPEATGCGLLLCESCAVALAGDHAGDLESMVAVAAANEEDYPLRADVHFLLSDGELMRQVYPSGIGE